MSRKEIRCTGPKIFESRSGKVPDFSVVPEAAVEYPYGGFFYAAHAAL
jgi:hypothetical protein